MDDAGPSRRNIRHGGRILADQLAAQGLQRVFSVPGESYLSLLDGLLDTQIDNVVCRHEGAAAMMAEAHGKMTQRPGVAPVTRGPGATNASAGLHVASQDSTPLILFVGQVSRRLRHREAFQEIDLARFFEPITKWAAEIDHVDRIPEFVTRAYHIAMSGRPGPVMLALPEDMLSDRGESSDSGIVSVPSQPVSEIDIVAVAKRLEEAARPIIIVGGSHWSEQAARDLEQIANHFTLPVAASFRRQHYFDNRHKNYIGDLNAGMNPELVLMLRESDCIGALGCRFADFPTQGFQVPGSPSDTRIAFHIYPDPNEIGRIWRVQHPMTGRPESLLAGLVAFRPAPSKSREAWLRRGTEAYRMWKAPRPVPGKAAFPMILSYLSDNLPEDAIITSGAGNYAAFLQRHFCFKTYGTQIAPTSGSMGYGLPAAIAAKLENPDRVVVCIAGDGCFQMVASEMATATQCGASIIVVVANNGMLGTIRMHQEARFPGRISGTSLTNPDFSALAAAYGFHGETVTETSEFAPAFQRALNAEGSALIDIQLDPEAITTDTTLQGISSAAIAGDARTGEFCAKTANNQQSNQGI